MSNGKPPIAWPWFIIGCILLLAALVAFFWGFSLGELTSSQSLLLMWLLPLASGFACGCFAGSLHASGTIGTLTISAFGGFAVWLLTYFLLPAGKPGSAPDSVRISLTSTMTFRQAAETIAGNDGGTVTFPDCEEATLNAKVKGGELRADNSKKLLETLQYRVADSKIPIRYDVEYLKDRGVYEIHCTR